MSESTIYHRIYTNISKVIPELETHLAEGTASGKSQSEPFMDLHYDYLRKDGDAHIVAFAHYYQSNGDQVPDPDMEVRIDTELKTAEALSFQNQFVYQQVYEEHDGKMYLRPKLKRDLNEFLNQWMKNARAQGHCIAFDEKKVEHESAEHEAESFEQSTRNAELNPTEQLTALREKNDNEKGQAVTR